MRKQIKNFATFEESRSSENLSQDRKYQKPSKTKNDNGNFLADLASSEEGNPSPILQLPPEFDASQTEKALEDDFAEPIASYRDLSTFYNKNVQESSSQQFDEEILRLNSNLNQLKFLTSK